MKNAENVKRGTDLLLPLNLDLDQVQSLEFALDKFRSAAAAKSWAVNHGMPPVAAPRTMRDQVVLRVREEVDFEEGTLRRERITRDVVATVGTPRQAPEVRKAVPEASASNEEKREAQAARARRWGIEALEGKGENLTFPSGGPTSEEDFADPVNLKYPVHTEENAANARVRFKQNADVYEEESSKRVVHERIVRAELEFGIEPGFDPDDPLDALLPGDLKDQLQGTAEGAAKRAPLVEFTKCGEVFVRKQEEGEPEEPADEVRFFGIVMKPNVPDVEGDVTSPEEVERGNFTFMTNFQTVGFMHTKDVSDRVKLIQDVIAPVDIEFPLPDGGTKKITKGTWYQELWSNDPEIVDRVKVKKTITGLSIGGRARRVPVAQMVDGALQLRPDLPFSPTTKRALEERVTKAEGDPALNEFRDLRVEEVSLVDAAANEEEFFIIKRRRDEMPGKEQPPTNPAADVKKTETPPATQTAPETPAPAPAPTPAPTPAEPTIAEQVAEGVKAGIQAAIQGGVIPASTEKRAPEPTPAPEDDPVTKGFENLGKRLDAIDSRLDAHQVALEKNGTVVAAAKGQSVPDKTEGAAPAPEVKPKKWAGTAVHSVFGNKQRTA